jgi:chloride channel 7
VVYGRCIQFNCHSESHYNDLATIFFNTQDDAIRNLFSTNTPREYNSYTLITFLVTFFLLALVTYGTAVPSGQFVPGIMIGATYGRLVGILVVNASNRDSVDEGTYVSESFTLGSIL